MKVVSESKIFVFIITDKMRGLRKRVKIKIQNSNSQKFYKQKLLHLHVNSDEEVLELRRCFLAS